MRRSQLMWTWFGGGAIALALAMSGCSGGGNTKMVPANPQSSELFERSYGYLVRGDADFTRLAPNYSTLRPFTRDTSMVIESESERKGLNPPPDGSVEYLHVRLNKPMTLRLIVADTTGNGLITYEFPDLPLGEYTMGSKGWPNPQINITKGYTWVYAYIVGDQRFRMKYQFKLDDRRHFTYMAPPPQPAPPPS